MNTTEGNTSGKIVTGSKMNPKNLAGPFLGVLYREFYVLRYPLKIGAWGFGRDNVRNHGRWNC